jgi:hypothetical protein
MNIFSLAQDPVHGTFLNSTCLATVGSPECVNFAFLSKNGLTTAPANPVQSTVKTFTPDPNNTLFMNSGDNLAVSLHDTAHGVQPRPRSILI